MNFNYFALFLISFIPLLMGSYWYHPSSFISKYSQMEFAKIGEISFIEIIFLFVLSLALVYSYMNVIIHQLGFYELFFTDIMLGNVESERIANEFLSKYGNKHRHFGHGALHGLITAFITALPFIGSIAILEQRSKKYVLHHFSYWLVTSIIVGGFISEFI